MSFLPVARRACWLATPFLLTTLLAAQGPGRARKLNGPLPVTVGGDVEDFALTPDDSRIAFRADTREEGSFWLFSVPADGTALPIRLHGRLAEDGSVQPDYTITPDGTRVVYRADELAEGAFELFVVPLDGSAPRLRLSGALVTGGAVQDFRLAPDGSRAVYVADQFADERALLFSVPLDGSASPVVLNGPLPAGGDVEIGAEITADGARVVYLADQDVNTVIELHSVPIAGGVAPTKLNGALAGDGDVGSFRLGPDGARVLYAAKQAGDSVVRLYSVPAGGGASVPLFSGAFSFFDDLQIDAPGSRVVHRRWTGSTYVLESQPIDGSAAPVALHPPLPLGRYVSQFAIAPDATRVAFHGDLDTNDVFELYSVPIDGSAAPVKLNGPLPAGGDTSGLLISPNGGSVLYVASGTPTFFLEVVPIDGSSAPVQLLGTPVAGWLPGDAELRFSADGATAFLLEGGATPDLLAVPADGTASAVQLNAGGRVQADFTVSADGARVFYRADQDALDVFELFVTPSTAASPVQLNQEFPANVLQGSVRLYQQSADRAVYVADQETPFVNELYGVATHGAAHPVKLNSPLAPGQDVSTSFPPQLTADGGRAVFLAGPEFFFRNELYSVATDGSAAAVLLSGPAVAGGGVFDFRLSADGTRVAYVADQDVDETRELFGTLTDGSIAPVKLHPPLAADRDVFSFDFTPDGARVVYVADQDTDEVSELYSTDGFLAPVKLNGPLAANEDVGSSFQISPDGMQVVYPVRPPGGPVRLLSVPVDGSAPAVALNDPSVTGGVGLFAIAAASGRVVFRAGSPGPGYVYSVPIDGSASPVQLGATAGAPEFRISPDGSFVVFPAFTELMRAPIDGSSPAIDLNGAAPTGSIGPGYAIIPDSTRVLYTSDQDVSGVVELYVVPSDGSAPPLELSPPLVLGGDVQWGKFQVSPDGARVVYLADLEVDERVELFLTRIDGGATVKLNGPLEDDVTSFEIAPDTAQVLFLAQAGSYASAELFACQIVKSPAGASTPTETVVRQQ